MLRSRKNQDSRLLSVKARRCVISEHHESRILIMVRSPSYYQLRWSWNIIHFVKPKEEASGALEDSFSDDDPLTLDHLLNSYVNINNVNPLPAGAERTYNKDGVEDEQVDNTENDKSDGDCQDNAPYSSRYKRSKRVPTFWRERVEKAYLTESLALDIKSLLNGTLLAFLLQKHHYRNGKRTVITLW